MPWSDQSFTNDQLKRRLAFLIQLRCNALGIGHIARVTGINRDTVRSYADMSFSEGDGKGPVNLSRVKSILDAAGDRWSTVMWAVEHSTDEKTFMEMLATDTTGQLRENSSKPVDMTQMPNYRLISVSYPLPFSRKTNR